MNQQQLALSHGNLEADVAFGLTARKDFATKFIRYEATTLSEGIDQPSLSDKLKGVCIDGNGFKGI